MSPACPHGAACIHCAVARTPGGVATQPRPERLLSIPEAAERLDCSDTYIRKQLLDQLEAVHIGRHTKITESSVERWIRRQVDTQ